MTTGSAREAVLKELFTSTNQGRMQGWVFNLRRPKFTDVRPPPFNYAFDFEDERVLPPASTIAIQYFDGIPI